MGDAARSEVRALCIRFPFMHSAVIDVSVGAGGSRLVETGVARYQLCGEA